MLTEVSTRASAKIATAAVASARIVRISFRHSKMLRSATPRISAERNFEIAEAISCSRSRRSTGSNGASDGPPTEAASLRLARCDYLAENKATPECPGPSYPNGAAAYRHASILPRLGAHTPFANSIARASRRIQGRAVLTAPAAPAGGSGAPVPRRSVGPPAVSQLAGRRPRSRSVHRSVPLDPFRAGAAHVMQLRPVTRRDEPAHYSPNKP
jgi:hypothetical protein